MPTGYILRQARTEADMCLVLDVIWAANYDPYDPFVQLVFPVLAYTPDALKDAIAESKSRFWEHHRSTPSSSWYLVVEEKSGKAVGCAQWEVHRENPFKDGAPKMEAPWWPKGEYREFCESVMNQVYKPRTSWMKRPHLALNWMAVIPTHRRRGIASVIMAAGISQADSLNVECWLEATEMGKPLYEKHGFRSLLRFTVDMERENASFLWKRAQHELTPSPIFGMWRPKGGVWETEEGAAKVPWDLGEG